MINWQEIAQQNGLSIDEFEKEIYSVYIEGGARTFSKFFSEQLFDRLYQFIAPSIIGAKNGMSYSKDFFIGELSEKIKLTSLESKSLSPDILVTAKNRKY